MGLRLPRLGRRVLIPVIILLVMVIGVGVFLQLRKDDDKNKLPQPTTLSQATMDAPLISSPSEARTKALKEYAEKTKDNAEKYKTYVSLCSDYNVLNDLKSAKEYCEKALAIADKAGIKAEDKKTVQNIKDFIDAKIEAASKTPTPPANGYMEPKE